jgi:hypothetical protein
MATKPGKLVIPPVCVAVRSQKHQGDCGIAVLAMALGVTHEQVLMVDPMAARDGLTTRQLQSIASRLGARLLSRPDADIHAETGILGIEFHKPHQFGGHWVYVHRGVVVDPGDGTLWDDVDDYLAAAAADWDVFLAVAPAARVRQRRKKQ